MAAGRMTVATLAQDSVIGSPAAKVVCFVTGGTILSAYDPQIGARVPAVAAETVVEAIDPALTQCAVEIVQLANAESGSFSAETVFRWAALIERALGREDVDGAVVLMGTNVLEEAAYLLDLVLPLGKPVVFTGAMRSADELGRDGPRNLAQAVSVAASEVSRGLGVLVVFNAEIHAARDVEKTHTTAIEAFASPAKGPLGRVLEDHNSLTPIVERIPPRHEQLRPPRVEANVALLTAGLGVDSTLVDAALTSGARGIVVGALGAGDLPAAMAPGIARALEARIPVIVARRTRAGAVGPRYGGVGEGGWLMSRGARFADDLSAAKARIKLMVVLGLGTENAVCQHFPGPRS